jgi:hypothetical protein
MSLLTKIRQVFAQKGQNALTLMESGISYIARRILREIMARAAPGQEVLLPARAISAARNSLKGA